MNDLFADQLNDIVTAAEHSAEDEKIALQLPALIKLGTASWAYPGWGGLVWKHRDYPTNALSQYGLHAYAQHPLFGCVEIDSSWYQPPGLQQYQQHASQLPSGFTVLAKSWRNITLPGNREFLDRALSATAY